MCYNRGMDHRTLTASHLTRLAERLRQYESLRVTPDGAVVWVRQYRAKTVGDLEHACQGYERGDHVSVVRYQDYWLIELSRPLPQQVGVDIG